MRPLRLRARNFRTYPELDVTFTDGLVGILGELRDAPEGASSNGSGKSSLLEALDIALFGRRSLAGYLTRGGDVDELMVELVFEHAGSTYRVRRTFSAKGRGKTTVDLERGGLAQEEDGVDYMMRAPVVFEPLTQASARETDEKIVEIIGLSRDTFRDSVYLRQGDGGYADPSRDPRQRKELLVEAVLGRDPIWPRLADQAKTRRKAAEQRLERIAGETDSLRALVATKGDVAQAAEVAAVAVQEATNAVGEAERTLETATARYQEARDSAASRKTIEAELVAARTALEGLRRRERAADQAQTDLAATDETLERLASPADIAALEGRVRDLEGQVVAWDSAVRDHEQADTRAREAKARKADLTRRAEELRAEADVVATHDEAVCDSCGQPMGADARAKRIEKYEKDAHALDYEARTIQIPDVPERPTGAAPTLELAAAKADLRAAQAAVTERARLEERRVQLRRDIGERPSDEELRVARDHVHVKEQLVANLDPVDLKPLEDEGRNARLALQTVTSRREAAVIEKTRVDETLNRILEAEEKLATSTSETAGLRADIDRDSLLERAYGRDGIPALIIENSAIPYIETEASRILSRLGSSFQVELRTQAENKTGGLRDTLDVVIIDQDGNEADYADGCSGGEQTRVGLALRIALARLLAHRRGAESRLLALDEPSYLDEAGMSALLNVLHDLETDFDLILLVSHVAELRDALDQVLLVVKENGRSRVETSALAEVAA